MNPDEHFKEGNAAPGHTCTPSIWDALYKDAERELGRSEEDLRKMAVQVFATILHHVLQERATTIWTAARWEANGRFSVEVNIVPRFRTKAAP